VPIDNWAQKRLPYRVNSLLQGLIPCNNYSGAKWASGFTDEQLIQWAILDTFDALSPAYDSPQSEATVQAWFEEALLNNPSAPALSI
jgi:hypothetical protein